MKWCPNDQTVLANEQVLPDGTCERCGARSSRRHGAVVLPDHRLRAGAAGRPGARWTGRSRSRRRQRNWIGRSEGAEIVFRIEELGVDVPVFTTRPGHPSGATFFVLAPEHELVARIDSTRCVRTRDAPRRRRPRSARPRRRPASSRAAGNEPGNGERMPVFVADYVLMDYGTGAIMAVPAHDRRDFDFARTFDLPVRQVVRPVDGEVDEGGVRRAHGQRSAGQLGRLDGLPAPEGGRRGSSSASSSTARDGSRSASRLRDWLFPSALLGCPIPIVLLRRLRHVPVPDEDLRFCSRMSRTTSRRAGRRSHRPRTG